MAASKRFHFLLKLCWTFAEGIITKQNVNYQSYLLVLVVYCPPNSQNNYYISFQVSWEIWATVKLVRVQGNHCWNAMYVIKLPEAQRRTTWGYSCFFISIQYNLEVILIYRFSWITAKKFYYSCINWHINWKKKTWKGTYFSWEFSHL